MAASAKMFCKIYFYHLLVLQQFCTASSSYANMYLLEKSIITLDLANFVHYENLQQHPLYSHSDLPL